MTRNERAAVHRLLRSGEELLRKGLYRDAYNAFGRVLLKDPRQDHARRGMTRARRLATEELRIDEASQKDKRPSSRSYSWSWRRTASHASLAHGQRRRIPKAATITSWRYPRTGSRVARKANARRMLMTACAASYSLLLGLTMLHWERFVDNLVRAPSPVDQQAMSVVSASIQTRGELAMTEALRLMEEGRRDSALALLEAIPRADPAYPFSRHLRRRLVPTRAEQ